jgi:hypothetical protein
MKPIKLLFAFAVLLIPGLASAQYYGGGGGGYYQQPSAVPGGFHQRTGRLTFGLGLGLGGMHDNGSTIQCDNCATSAAVEFDGHIGGMLSPRFALLFEAQSNLRTIHSDAYNGDTVLSNNAGMIAGQYWLTPQLWIKGGIGLANLQVNDPGYATYTSGTGGAIMGAVGLELASMRFFAIDLQGRIIEANYGGDIGSVTAANVGIGFNWY